MKITRSGVWGTATAVLCTVLLVLAWFLVVGPQRAQAEEARLATDATRAQNGQLERRIADLRTEFALLPQRRAELAAIREAMPADPALAALLDELDVVASDTGAQLDSVVTGTATTLIDAVVPPQTGATDEATDPAASGGDAPVAGDDAADPPVVTEAVPPAPRRLAAGTSSVDDSTAATPGPDETAASTAAPSVLAAIPVTITVGGDFFDAASFVETVQGDLVRALVVDSVDVVAGTDEDGSVVATLTGRVFAFVDPEAVDAGGAATSPATGPGASPTARPTAGPTASPTSSPITGPEATDD